MDGHDAFFSKAADDGIIHATGAERLRRSKERRGTAGLMALETGTRDVDGTPMCGSDDSLSSKILPAARMGQSGRSVRVGGSGIREQVGKAAGPQGVENIGWNNRGQFKDKAAKKAYMRDAARSRRMILPGPNRKANAKTVLGHTAAGGTAGAIGGAIGGKFGGQAKIGAAIGGAAGAVLGDAIGQQKVSQRSIKGALKRSHARGDLTLGHSKNETNVLGYAKKGAVNKSAYTDPAKKGQRSAGRAVTAGAFGWMHGAVAGKKGRKLGAAGSSIGHSMAGSTAGRVIGGALGAKAGLAAPAAGVGGMLGGTGGNYAAYRSSSAKGRYKRISKAASGHEAFLAES